MRINTGKDEQLIQKIKNGSELHFQKLFERYWSRLYSIANNSLDCPEDAQDIVQEIFIDIWKRRDTLEVDNTGAYLYACVRFGIAKKLKKIIAHRHEELFVGIEDKADLESTLEFQDLVAYVEGKIDQLPDRCKEIFKLSRFEQFSNKEIADKLHLSTSTVENHINKALKVLKQDDRLSDELTLSIVILLLSAS